MLFRDLLTFKKYQRKICLIKWFVLWLDYFQFNKIETTHDRDLRIWSSENIKENFQSTYLWSQNLILQNRETKTRDQQEINEMQFIRLK